MGKRQSGTTLIHQAQPTDLPQVIAAARQTWEGTYAHILSPHVIQSVLQQEYSLENLERQIHSPMHALYVAVKDNEVVGYAGYRRTQEGEVANLTHLYIRPKFQHQGIGGQLLAAGAAALEETGVSEVRTLVAKANAPAVCFYEQHGFSAKRAYMTFVEDQMLEVIEMNVPLSRIAREQGPNEDQATG